MKSNSAKLIIAVFLIASMMSIIIASCGGGNNDSGTTTEGGTNNLSLNETENATEKDDGRLYEKLPASNFEGHNFNVMTVHADRVNWFEWGPRDIYAEEETGELVNDAVYKRNRIIEDRYNINIKEDTKGENDILPAITKMVAAGETSHDIVLPRLMNVAALALEGNFIDYHSVENINLENPWWNQAAVNQLSIGGKLFFVQSDMLIIDNDATSAMLFNKQLLAELALEDPYELVLSGKWTFDKLVEMATKSNVSLDMNGDGKMYILDDRFGLVAQKDSTLSFYLASGGTFVTKNSNDYPEISFGSEKSYTILSKITDLMRDSPNVVDLHRHLDLAVYDEQAKMFSENRALFTWIRMRVVEKLRGMDADFGILPLPKYDANQSEYYSVMNPYVSTAIAIPITNNNIERTGIILEALTEESKYTLQPAYYELNLKTKLARDEESSVMLDIIFDNKNTIYNVAEIYKFGNFANDVSEIPTSNKDPNYASLFEGKQKVMQNDINKFIETFENLTK